MADVQAADDAREVPPYVRVDEELRDRARSGSVSAPAEVEGALRRVFISSLAPRVRSEW
ncbi:hypothetical protein GCM10020221_36290 [Streptomyces thioluteus]|uniref:Uncharacterized protein n=1 Tax=Streptomyces thioluteus TaxID=66431 RepID=A0ABP6JLJ5_STRTU